MVYVIAILLLLLEKVEHDDARSSHESYYQFLMCQF